MRSRTPLSFAVLALLAAGLGPFAPASRAGEGPGAATRDVLAGLGSSEAAEREKALDALPAALREDVKTGARALPLLREILRSRGWAERAKTVRLLLEIEHPEAVSLWLERLDPAKDDDDRVLSAAVAAAEDLATDPAFARRLVDLARDVSIDACRRALAVESLGGLRGPVVGAVLSSPIPGGDWVVESCRALALGRRGGLASVPPLIELLGSEDASPRAHAWESLTRITRQRFPAQKAPWAAWWAAWRAAHGKDPLPPLPSDLPRPAPAPPAEGDRYQAPDAAHVPRYYGIPLPRRSDESRVVFCVDVSQSMYGQGIDQAKRELTKTIKDMTTAHLFDVVAFNENVMPWAGRLAHAHPVVKARALSWVAKMEPTSYTNLYDAVETAFEYMGRGRHPAAETARLDAVFLLSDGAPNRGRYRVAEQVIREIAALSQRQVPVNTIGAGEEVFPLLRAIADATGGTFVDAFE